VTEGPSGPANRPDPRALSLLSRSDFLSFASHELRTPLTTILTWAQMLKSRLDDPWQRNALERVERNVRTEVRLVDDLLDLARIAEGRLRMACERLDLATVVEDAIGPLRTVAEAKKVRLFVSTTSVAATADHDRLVRVVSGLVANAIKFTDEGGSVTVTLDQTAGQARLVVADTGHGMDADRLAQIFEGGQPNKQVRREPGLGVSLFIFRHIAEAHGGDLSGDSDGVGRGSNFVLAVPAVAAD
jgi:signal transduction histidine kinase